MEIEKYPLLPPFMTGNFHQDSDIKNDIETYLDGWIAGPPDDYVPKLRAEFRRFIEEAGDRLDEEFEAMFGHNVYLKGWEMTALEWLGYIDSLLEAADGRKDAFPFLRHILSRLQEGKPTSECDADYIVSKYSDNEFYYLAIRDIDDIFKPENRDRASGLIEGLRAAWPGNKTSDDVLRHIRHLIEKSESVGNTFVGLETLSSMFCEKNIEDVMRYIHDEMGQYYCERQLETVVTYLENNVSLSYFPPTRRPGGAPMTQKDWLLLLRQYLEKALATFWPADPSAPPDGRP